MIPALLCSCEGSPPRSSVADAWRGVRCAATAGVAAVEAPAGGELRTADPAATPSAAAVAERVAMAAAELHSGEQSVAQSMEFRSPSVVSLPPELQPPQVYNIVIFVHFSGYPPRYHKDSEKLLEWYHSSIARISSVRARRNLPLSCAAA